MRKSRVTETEGAGPDFSGAYWTLRIIKRTELLQIKPKCHKLLDTDHCLLTVSITTLYNNIQKNILTKQVRNMDITFMLANG